jgi:hypothetical protein
VAENEEEKEIEHKDLIKKVIKSNHSFMTFFNAMTRIENLDIKKEAPQNFEGLLSIYC